MTESVLILGGGIAGLSASETLAELGIDVHLVERKDTLGGNAFAWACMATDVCQNCGACLVAELVDRVPQMQHVTIHTGSSLSSVTKEGGGYLAVIEGSAPAQVHVRQILVATGMTPYDPSDLTTLKYADQRRVITTVDLNRLFREDGLQALLNGKSDPRIAFVQCVGSRNREKGRDYCSQVCCKTAVRDAIKLTHLYPGSKITIFNLDLQVIGKEFRTQLRGIQDRISILQGVPAEILTGKEEDMLTVIREDETRGIRVAHHFDLIVLAVGMLPSEGVSELSTILDAQTDRWGFFGGEETRVPEGVYVAGAANGPMDILTARRQAMVAAARIAGEIMQGVDPPWVGSMAVWGNGATARRVASELVGQGCRVFLLDPGTGARIIHESIQYFPDTRLTSVEGTVGRFIIRVISGNEAKTFLAKALVIAEEPLTEFVLQAGLDNLGIGVKSLSEFLDISRKTPESIPVRLAFWVDYAGPEWKDYCRQALIAAAEMARSGKTVSFLMDKMLVHGLSGQRIYDAARSDGVVFLRVADPGLPSVRSGNDGLMIKLREATLPDVDLVVACDWIIVPERIMPPQSTREVSAALKLDLDREGFFQEANVRHRLIGSPRRGIYFVGAGHDEVDAEDLAEELDALKSALAEAKEVQGRDADVSIREAKCVKCLTCYRICPHGSVMVNPQSGRPFIVPEACFECGICVSSCPACAIEQKAYVKEDWLKEPFEDLTAVFACERSGWLALKEAENRDMVQGEDSRVIRVNCAGRLSAETLMMPLIRGAKRVVVAACHKGNCRSLKGNVLAAARADYLLTDLSMPASRISFNPVAANEPAKAAKIVF